MNKTVSIVIPCRNEERYIARCLDSIVNCNYPKELLEVFVCDGKSDDGTVAEIKEFNIYDYINLLINEKLTTPYALNIGIQNSASDVVIILGAHAEIYPDYIDKCVAILNSEKTIGCTGGIIVNVNEDETSLLIALAMSSTFGVGNAHFRTGSKEGYVDTVAFGAYKREVFTEIGFFDEELSRNQDDEFNYRLVKAGYKIFLSPEIRTRYYVRSSIKKLFNQYYQYGYWKVYVNVKHKAVTTARQLIPALFVFFILLFGFLSFLSPTIRLLFFSGLTLYFLLAMYSAVKKSNNLIRIFKILWIFLILHFSYGLGYIEGIIDFLLLRKKISDKKAILNR
jgi:glycosyltransferase involved in cell wall biosynthesis